MKNLASFLESKNISISSTPTGSLDTQSVQSLSSSSSSRRDTQGTLRREGINPILSSNNRSTNKQTKTDPSLTTIQSPFLEKRRWINLGEGWHQITAQGSGAITRCGLYSVIESSNSTKTFGCLYIPRSDAAYNASMCDKPEYDLLLQAKMHFKQNTFIQPQMEILFSYKDGNNYLRIVCDGISKNWSVIHCHSGRDYCLAQMIDPNLRCNVFYSLLIQIRGNCISFDVNGIPVVTKLKITNLNDLSGFMGLKATNSKFSVKGWKLKGLNVSKYRACIPSTEEGDDGINLTRSASSSAIEGDRTPHITPVKSLSFYLTKPTPSSQTKATPTSNSSFMQARQRGLGAETPELTIEGKQNNQMNQEESESNRSMLKPSGFPPELVDQLFASCERNIAENILQDIVQNGLDIGFDDIASLADAKRILYEAIILPTMIPEFFKGIREPWKGILLYGPPGTGKTMLAKAVCSLQKSTFFNCSAASLISKYRGDSEKIIRCLFTAAKIFAPSVIFVDEIDALVSSRTNDSEHEASRRLKTELFCQIDGLSSNRGSNQVVFLAATNCPWDLDPAMRRRLEKRIYVPLPDYEARIELINILIKELALSDDFDLEDLAMMTEGFSGSDLQIALREASMMPMRRLLDAFSPEQIVELRKNGEITVPQITMNDCIQALQNTRPSVAASSLSKFKAWEEEFGNK